MTRSPSQQAGRALATASADAHAGDGIAVQTVKRAAGGADHCAIVIRIELRPATDTAAPELLDMFRAALVDPLEILRRAICAPERPATVTVLLLLGSSPLGRVVLAGFSSAVRHWADEVGATGTRVNVVAAPTNAETRAAEVVRWLQEESPMITGETIRCR